MSAINHTKPWFDYFCTADTDCQTGFSCHHKYCIPQLKEGETCKDAKDTIAPFIARTNDTYHLYCDLPDEMTSYTTCPTGCQPWENCHGGICFLKNCNEAEVACRKGDINACADLGTTSSDIICYNMTPHGNTHPKGETGNNGKVEPMSEDGLTSAQVGGIAGGVSAAVVILAAVGAFFLVKKRRAAKAARNQANSDLPVYTAPDYAVQTTEKQSA